MAAAGDLRAPSREDHVPVRFDNGDGIGLGLGAYAGVRWWM